MQNRRKWVQNSVVVIEIQITALECSGGEVNIYQVGSRCCHCCGIPGMVVNGHPSKCWSG